MSGNLRLWARALVAALAMCSVVPVSGVFAQSDATVDMLGISFRPQEVHVAPGATVTWTNSSPLAHTVTADDGVSFDSGIFGMARPSASSSIRPGCTSTSASRTVRWEARHVATIIVDDPDGLCSKLRKRRPSDAAAQP